MKEKNKISTEMKEALNSASPEKLNTVYDLMIGNLISSERFSHVFIDGVDNLLCNIFQFSFSKEMKLERKCSKYNEITFSNKFIVFGYIESSLSVRFGGYSANIDLQLYACSFIGPEIFIPVQKNVILTEIKDLSDVIKDYFGDIDHKNLCFVDFMGIIFVCKISKDDFRFIAYNIKDKKYSISG